jgi:hypothetical protein
MCIIYLPFFFYGQAVIRQACASIHIINKWRRLRLQGIQFQTQ